MHISTRTDAARAHAQEIVEASTQDRKFSVVLKGRLVMSLQLLYHLALKNLLLLEHDGRTWIRHDPATNRRTYARQNALRFNDSFQDLTTCAFARLAQCTVMIALTFHFLRVQISAPYVSHELCACGV